MTNWPEVVDTSIKIGLGALLGGLFSVWLARLNQRHEVRRLYLERRWNLLQEAQVEIMKFGAAISEFWANTRNAAWLRDKSKPLASDQRGSLMRQEQEVFGLFATLAAARSKLLLLGERTC